MTRRTDHQSGADAAPAAAWWEIAAPVQVGIATSAIRLIYGCGHEVRAVSGDGIHHTCPFCFASRAEAAKSPPAETTFQWCPVCGRSDRFEPFSGSHDYRGTRCSGKPVIVVYEFKQVLA